MQTGRAIVAGPSAQQAADYGITTEEVERLSQEIDDYAAVIAAPQQGIAQRKALTRQLAEDFNTTAAIFEALDKLMLHFARTPQGRALVEAYQDSPIIRDLGRKPSRTAPARPELVATAQ